jgi:ABC-type lipoprotein release transport system permease subunit
MRPALEVARTGVTAVLLHPQRSAVTVLALVAALLPYLVGLGIARGLEEEAAAAVRYGPDLYLTGEQFGRPVPVPLAALAAVRRIPGVEAVEPRIVGRVELGKDRLGAVLVGVPVTAFPPDLECVEGRLYGGGPRHELVVGSDLAEQLRLTVGTVLPPFYHSRSGEHVSEVVGIFRSDVAAWQARLVVTSFETATQVFDQPGLATDVLIRCRPGYEAAVARAVTETVTLDPSGDVRPRVLARTDLAALLPLGLYHREGAFTLVFVVAFAVAILAVLVTSGYGAAGRRREVGILKAVGWQTDEVLLRAVVESTLLGLAGAAVAVVLAYAWLKGLNGYGIAGVFLGGLEWGAGIPVPFRLAPVPVLLALLLAQVVVQTGSLYPTWRAALTPPRDALR